MGVGKAIARGLGPVARSLGPEGAGTAMRRILQFGIDGLGPLPGAKSAYDAATIGFENGKFNFLEVLDAQRTYFTAKSQYLKALGEAHRAAADVDRLLGASTVSGLIATHN